MTLRYLRKPARDLFLSDTYDLIRLNAPDHIIADILILLHDPSGTEASPRLKAFFLTWINAPETPVRIIIPSLI